MRIVETKVFSFDELSEEAKQTAIQWYRESLQEDVLTDFNETCQDRAEQLGFWECEFQWSLNYCQGDGLSFSANDYINLEYLYNKVLGEGKERTAELLAINTTKEIKGNTGRYCYARKNDIELYIENHTSTINTDRIDEVCNEVQTLLQDIYMNLCKELEKDGYAEIEYQNSDEAIIANIIANEYEFTEDGGIF